jgi:hypothetical protein
VLHTELCTARQLAYAVWIARWPNACTHCHARGVLYDSGYWDARAGEGLPPSEEPCEHCSGKEAKPSEERHLPAFLLDTPEHIVGHVGVQIDFGYCPRCAGVMEVSDPVPCLHCGWNWGQGPDDYMPDNDCYCDELVEMSLDDLPW